ncbi:MAG TPA: carbon-nitrogen hydrolase family protein [Streptosporangiaceae bacterium]
MRLRVLVGQLEIGWQPANNARRIAQLLRAEAAPGSLVILPEAAISGYDDDLSGLDALDPAELQAAAVAVAALAVDLRVHVVCGSLLPEPGGWCNAALYFGPGGERWMYRKVNLATHERGRLTAGRSLPVLELRRGGQDAAGQAGAVRVGVQLCRELKFPEQWHVLARGGAQVLAYLTYAANPTIPAGVWRSHIISRAAETQRFVAAANVAHPRQHCPSMLVSPAGELLAESTSTGPQALHADLDLTQVSDWLVSQQRGEVVTIGYAAPGAARADAVSTG